MPRFHIAPCDGSLPSSVIIVPDAASVLTIVQRLDCKEADVTREDGYSFAIRLGEHGLWCIHQREQAEKTAISLTG